MPTWAVLWRLRTEDQIHRSEQMKTTKNRAVVIAVLLILA